MRLLVLPSANSRCPKVKPTICSSSMEASAWETWNTEDGEARPIAYNLAFPIETFDFIITDECHRSIYGVWQQVLDYFDAFVIGLTATPSRHTLGFFNQNLVAEYPNERTVADGVNVGFEIFRINTQVTQAGGSVEAGFHVPIRDKPIDFEQCWNEC
jgi:type I restriction enzyme, R subunit